MTLKCYGGHMSQEELAHKEPLLLEAESIKHIGLNLWHFSGNDDFSVRVGILNGTQNK
jgi:hypothetical protein